MYRIQENKQVLILDKTDTYEQWIPIGFETEVEITVEPVVHSGEAVIITMTWLKFNLETGAWEKDEGNHDAFVLYIGERTAQITPDGGVGSIVTSFDAAGEYSIGVRNPNCYSRDVIIKVL